MLYQAPKWLPNGHLQTIYPARCIKLPPVNYRRERWTSPDQDFIDVDFVDGPTGGPMGGPMEQPMVVLFHGLEGSSDSHYSRTLMAQVADQGWQGAVVHFRGCSGEINHAPRFYHSGDTAEINWVLHTIRKRHQGRLFVAGISLGGNALLRWLGEEQHQAEIIDAACAISAPLDLAQGGAALSRGFNRIYTQMFLKTLKPKCLLKLAQFPDLFDRERMLASRNLYEFDNVITAPLHGYRNTEDYWHRASAKHILGDITLPTLVLNAQNDPFLPSQYLPQQAADCVTLDYPAGGGHVGFVHGRAPGNLNWLPQRIMHFFNTGSTKDLQERKYG